MAGNALAGRKWPTETTLKFLRLYESFPCLWDMYDSQYKDRQVRDDACNVISKAMGIPGFGVGLAMSKLRAVRNTYTLELNKVLKSKKLGKKYVPCLKWFDAADKFLRRMVKTGTKRTYLTSEVSEFNAERTQEKRIRHIGGYPKRLQSHGSEISKPHFKIEWQDNEESTHVLSADDNSVDEEIQYSNESVTKLCNQLQQEVQVNVCRTHVSFDDDNSFPGVRADKERIIDSRAYTAQHQLPAPVVNYPLIVSQVEENTPASSHGITIEEDAIEDDEIAKLNVNSDGRQPFVTAHLNVNSDGRQPFVTAHLNVNSDGRQPFVTAQLNVNSDGRLPFVTEEYNSAVETRSAVPAQNHSKSKIKQADISSKSAGSVTEDEFDIFGKGVACHLRSLPLRAALHCQTFIQSYLVEERLKHCEIPDNRHNRATNSPITSNKFAASSQTHSSRVQEEFVYYEDSILSS